MDSHPAHGSDWIYIGDIKSEDTRDVLRIQAQRARDGEKKYGPLDVLADGRDMDEESLEEECDRNFYDTVKRLRRIKLKRLSAARG